jgi:acyl-CoA thioesterase
VSSVVNGADEQRLAERVVRKMLEHDAFSAWLGLEVLEVRPRYAAVRMTVRPQMINGFGVCHGGVTFAVADSAFAFAANTHGRVTVSIDNSITYPSAVSTGDVLTAVATEESAANRIAFYAVRVTNQNGGLVAIFRGTVYRTRRGHFTDDDSGERLDEEANA